MVTAEELTVAIRSEGVSETQEDLEGVEGAMDETANSAGNSAEELEGFSQRFQGAMSAAVAALAVAAAGLLSQVPVLGELMAGLFAIVEAVAFQMDGVLRPVLTPLTDAFFDLANAIFEADGIAGDIIGVLGTIASIAAIVGLAMSKFGVSAAAVVAKLSPLIGVVKAVGAALVGIVAGISATTAALAIAVAAVIAFAVAYLTNFRGVRDTTNEIIGDIFGFFVGLASDLAGWASDLASDAFTWGRNLIDRFIDGIRAAIGRLRDFLGDLRDIGGSVGISVPDLGDIGGGGGGNGGGASSRPRFGAATSGGSGASQIDGRQITESTGRYRSDPSNRRGL